MYWEWKRVEIEKRGGIYPKGLYELEKEPSFVRQNIKIEDSNYSTESNVSRYTLSEGDDKKMEIKPNNPFLHDNVD